MAYYLFYRLKLHKIWHINAHQQSKTCVHIVKVGRDQLVEIVIFDKGTGINNLSGHPMHLHGHSFAVVAMNRFLQYSYQFFFFSVQSKTKVSSQKGFKNSFLWSPFWQKFQNLLLFPFLINYPFFCRSFTRFCSLTVKITQRHNIANLCKSWLPIFKIVSSLVCKPVKQMYLEGSMRASPSPWRKWRIFTTTLRLRGNW